MKPDCVLGLATGSSPLEIYAQLITRYQNGDLDFSGVSTVNLDEYRGLAPDNEQSYHFFMQQNLFGHINIQPENTYLPDGMEQDVEKACQRYDAILQKLGGVDLQLLGLGPNGHIGFNEPGSDFPTKTHCVRLAEETIAANSRFFQSKEEVPTHAYTMGIQSILMAKKILMVVSGEKKADILAKAFAGPVTPAVPASILQMHPDVTLVADQAALSVFLCSLDKAAECGRKERKEL
jgi:glucosamine-6-phosphate deaminase